MESPGLLLSISLSICNIQPSYFAQIICAREEKAWLKVKTIESIFGRKKESSSKSSFSSDLQVYFEVAEKHSSSGNCKKKEKTNKET